MRNFAFVIAGIIAVSSCAPSDSNSVADDQVIQLVNELDESLTTLNNTPFDDLMALEEEVVDHYNWFYEEYTDTSKPDFWLYNLNDLGLVHKAINKARAEKDMLYESIEFSKSQLNDLQEAYEAGELDSLSFHTYLMDEEQVTKSVVRRVIYRSGETQKAIDAWAKVKPSLDSTRAYYTDAE